MRSPERSQQPSSQPVPSGLRRETLPVLRLQRPVTQIPRLTELLAAKKLGRKSGAGFYEWRDGKAVKPPAATAAPADLVDRLILVMVNECVACLREGIVADADLVDAGAIFGAGFAPFRGGPLHYAGSAGTGR